MTLSGGLLRIIASTFCILPLIFPTFAFSKEPFGSNLLDSCPINSRIRVADRQAAARYTALEACASQIVTTSPTPFRPDEEPDDGVVRIIGVDAEPLKKRQRDDRRREGQGAATAMAAPAYDREVRLAASKHRIDPLLLHAIIDTESAYRPAVTSPAGAVGLMQIMPATGTGLGVDRTGLVDPVRNIDAGARHLKSLQRRYGRDFELILSAYNAGEGAVARYGNRMPPYRETREYVGKVMGKYHRLRTGSGQTW
jgi:hypothetical protein